MDKVSEGVNSHRDTLEQKVWFDSGSVDCFCLHTTYLLTKFDNKNVLSQNISIMFS